MGCLFQVRKNKRETLKQQTQGNNSVEDNNNQPQNNDYSKDNEEDRKKITEDVVGTLGEIGTNNETCSENATDGRICENAGSIENVTGSADEIWGSLHSNVLSASETETALAFQEQSIGSENHTNQEKLSEPCGELKCKSGSEDLCIGSDGHSESPELCEETLADTSCSNGCGWTEAPESSSTHEEKVGECLAAKNEECCAITPRNDCEMLSKEAPLQVVKTTTDCAEGNKVKPEDIPREVNCKGDNFEEEKILRPSVPNTSAEGLQCKDIKNKDLSYQTLDQESLSKFEPSQCETKDDNLGWNESKGLVIDREHDQAGDETTEQVCLNLASGDNLNALATVLENAPPCALDWLENEGQMNELSNQKEEDMSIASSDSFDIEIGFNEQDQINVVMLDQVENNNVPEPNEPEISKIFGNLLKMKKKITLKPLSPELISKRKETCDEIHLAFLSTNNHCLPPTNNQGHLPKCVEESDPGLLGGTTNSRETELNENSSDQLSIVENSFSKGSAIPYSLRFPQSSIPFLDKIYVPEDKDYVNPSPVYQGSIKGNCDSSPSPVLEKYSSRNTEEKTILPGPLPAVQNFAQDVGNFPQESIKNSSADVYKKVVSSLTSPTYSEVTASTSSSSISSEQRTSVDFQDLGGNSDIRQLNRHPSVISISDDSESSDYELEENKRKKVSKSSKNLSRKHSYYKGKTTSGWKKHLNKKTESESGSPALNYCDVVSEIIKSSSLNTYNEVNGRENETSDGKNKVCNVRVDI